MASALHTVEVSGLGRYMREALWAYPLTETAHIAGLALLFGSIVIVDLRLIGLGRRVPVGALVRFAVPWSITGFLVAATSGLLMFTAHAAEFIEQPVFLLKMSLIVVAGINAVLLRRSSPRGALHDDRADPSPRVRWAAAASILLWLGVIACGRLLAYL